MPCVYPPIAITNYCVSGITMKLTLSDSVQQHSDDVLHCAGLRCTIQVAFSQSRGADVTVHLRIGFSIAIPSRFFCNGRTIARTHIHTDEQLG